MAAPAAAAWDEARLQAGAQRQGPRASVAWAELQALQRSLLTVADEVERLRRVNRHINQRLAFRTDVETWGQDDFWATPLEALGRGQGDCEDYAVAKYSLLRAAGMPAARLRLVYVRALLPGPDGRLQADAPAQAHMVLAWYATPDADPLVLDNLRPDIVPASQRPDLSPVFSFNDEVLWKGAGPQPDGDPRLRLSPWRRLLQRLDAEGWR